MSDSRSGPVSLARYRPILYLFTGVAAAYAILYVHSSVTAQPSSTPLRRRNAVRRSRPTEAEELRVANTPSFRAIAHLEQLERQNGVYGTFRIETEDGRRVESGLLPSLLATRDQLMQEVGVPPAHAERMREMMEDTFLESFLALDFPSAHILPEDSPERIYLTEQLQRRGISRAGIERALIRFNADVNYGDDLRRRRQNGERVTLSTSTFPDVSGTPQNVDGGETVDDQSVFSWRDGNNGPSNQGGQNLLNLLYYIAEDQARRDGYIHRGVTCNSCGAMPIQGIRYRCANCIDYDLCETCEAMQVHIKTHLFYKVRIPAPFLGNPRQPQPVWYPGKPAALPRSLPRPLANRLMKECNFENTELDALWDQFRCLANYEWADDPNKLHMAIDRKTFDRCFVPNTSIRPPPPSLIYDRMFAFYDTNGDNLIGFEEFLKGLASLNNTTNDERLRRVFRGYDIDGDGFVERKDFLRVFRAYYALSRELTRDIIAGMEDDYSENVPRNVVLGSQPISAAFTSNIPQGERSRTAEGKGMNAEGDMVIVDNEGVLRQDGDDTADRHAVVGDAAVRAQFGRHRPVFSTTSRLAPGDTLPRQSDAGEDAQNENDENVEDGASETSESDQSSSSVASGTWPPAEHVLEEDIIEALGIYVPPQDITDPIEQARVADAVYRRMREDDQRRILDARRRGIDERWRRRAFYTDEEDGATTPEGYERDPAIDGYSDDDEPEFHPLSPRSRSSSKVRFQDDLNDEDDYDMRSNPSTSSRSIPVGERWGGFEIPEAERDVGKEILYQVTQQGFNELLDILFKPREDLLMEVYRTRADRKIWAREIELAVARAEVPSKSSPKINAPPEEELEGIISEQPLDDLLQRAGYAIASPVLAPADTRRELVSPSPEAIASDDDVQPTHLADPASDTGLGQAHPFEESDTASFASDHEDSLTVSQVSEARVQDDTSYYDPTLPHHRPDTETPCLVSSLPQSIVTAPEASVETESSPSESLANSNIPDFPVQLQLQPDISSLPPTSPHSFPDAETTAPKLPPSPMQPLPAPRRVEDQAAETETPAPRRPSLQTLARWAYLDQVEREAKQRGGNGARLNFEEFSRRMAADRGRRLTFVSSWIELASF
ncbi:Recoverin [Penicillium bovifimosum]|uniref:Recoverin n=1 Tax=Penicillium bovifimosum TaxID=126998 RepID=A0A9W9GUM8_9EURO|nr:Recoverin [Penicillium bovifimosum]KAJ5130228.1 Recoverin [Penicillium bovifimosum]